MRQWFILDGQKRLTSTSNLDTLNPMHNPLYLHITYVEHLVSFEEIFRTAAELNFDGIELRQRPIGYTGTQETYLDELTRAFEKFPLQGVSFGYPCVNLMQSDAEARLRDVEAAADFYREASKRFPVHVVNAFTGNLHNPCKELPYLPYQNHGSAIATEAQWKQAVDGFKPLVEVAQQCGFRFAFETHGHYLHDTIDSARMLCERIDAPGHVGILLDYPNLTLFPKHPTMEEAIQQTGDLLFYVHLKNLLLPPNVHVQVSALGAGIFNIRQQLELLTKAGFSGPLAIESPRPGDRIHFLKEDVAYYRSLVEDLRHSF